MPVIKAYSPLGWRIKYYIPSLPDIDEDEEQEERNEHAEAIYLYLVKITVYLQAYDNKDYAKFADIFFTWLSSYQHFLTDMSTSIDAISNKYDLYTRNWRRFFKLSNDESITHVFIKQLITINDQLDESHSLKFYRLYTFLNQVWGELDLSINHEIDILEQDIDNPNSVYY